MPSYMPHRNSLSPTVQQMQMQPPRRSSLESDQPKLKRLKRLKKREQPSKSPIPNANPLKNVSASDSATVIDELSDIARSETRSRTGASELQQPAPGKFRATLNLDTDL